MEIPERNTLLNPSEDITYSNFAADENLNFFHQSVRQGDLHGALQSALEAVMTGENVKIDFFRQIYVILSADVGPANPSLIMLAHRFLWRGSVDQQTLAMLVEMIVKSPKDRLFDWVRHSLILTLDNSIPTNANQITRHLRLLLIKLEMELEDKNFGAAVQIAGRVYHLDIAYPQEISNEDWTKMRREFDAPRIVTKCRRTAWSIWLPIVKMAMHSTQKVCNLVCYLYDITTNCRQLYLLQWIHAIWAICNTEQVGITWYESSDLRLVSSLSPLDERLRFIEAHRRRENIVPIKKLIVERPFVKYMILKETHLRYVWREGREEQMRWLLECIRLWKDVGTLDKNFVLPEDYLLE
jgi:hypothetical protein